MNKQFELLVQNKSFTLLLQKYIELHELDETETRKKLNERKVQAIKTKIKTYRAVLHDYLLNTLDAYYNSNVDAMLTKIVFPFMPFEKLNFINQMKRLKQQFIHEKRYEQAASARSREKQLIKSLDIELFMIRAKRYIVNMLNRTLNVFEYYTLVRSLCLKMEDLFALDSREIRNLLKRICIKWLMAEISFEQKHLSDNDYQYSISLLQPLKKEIEGRLKSAI